MRPPKVIMSLSLDEVGDDDAHPRRFLKLPSGHLLSYGGMNGNISCLVETMDDDGADDEGNNKNKINKGSSSNNNNKFVIVQRYDDEVRAVAVSPNGKRIAIGFDDGSTQIYKFDDYDIHSSDNVLHPFLKAIEKVRTTNSSNNNNNNDHDDLLSQDFLAGHTGMEYFAGPRFESPIRDLQFIPVVQENDYLLAIASEGGLCLVVATSLDEMTASPRLLEQEVRDHHDHGGIRSIAINDNADIMASLGMDGRLCLWDLNEIALLVREDILCIPKKDVGEILGADPYDRSCRPLIYNNNVIVTPGKLTPYVRGLQKNTTTGVADTNTANNILHVVDDTTFEGATENGHMEPIVSMTYFSNNECLATSGRDAQIILWRARNSSLHDNDDDDNNNNNNTLTSLPNATTMKWQIVEKHILKSPATDLCYYKNKIYAACADGTCAVVDVDKRSTRKVEQEVSSLTSVPTNTTRMDKTQKGPKAKSINKSKSSGMKSKIDDADDDNDDDDVDFSNTDKVANRVRFVADEADESESEDGPNVPGLSRTKTDDTDTDNVMGGDYDNDDHDEDDVDEDDGMEPNTFTPRFHPTRNNMIMMPVVKSQPAFSPSSTPLDLTRRYLCWNHIGSVTVMRGEDQRNTIDINFTDSAFKRPISFTDNMNFIVGSVGEEGGIFASDLQEDDDDDDDDQDDFEGLDMSDEIRRAIRKDRKKNPKAKNSIKPMGSSIFFYRFETFGSLRNKDWYLTLPDGERVLGASCGEGWAASMTR
jgi:WD40 repeat protein